MPADTHHTAGVPYLPWLGSILGDCYGIAMAYEIVPVVQTPSGPSVSDDQLRAIWNCLHREGRVEMVFYAGGLTTVDQFLAFMRSPHIMPCIAVDAESRGPLIVGWLTNVHNKAAFAHYFVLGRPRWRAGWAMRDYWMGLREPDGTPLLEVLIAITPETHTQGLRATGIMGFTTIGTIPRYCNCVYAGGRQGGVISHYERRTG